MPELCQSSHAQVRLVPGSKAHGAGPVLRGPGWAPVTQPRHRERHSMRVAPATQLCFQNTGQGETISCYSVLLIRIFTALPVLNPKQMVQLSPAPQFDDPWGLPAKCTFQRIIPQALLTLIWSLLSIRVLHPSSHSPALPHDIFYRGSLFHLKGWWSHRLLWPLKQREL